MGEVPAFRPTVWPVYHQVVGPISTLYTLHYGLQSLISWQRVEASLVADFASDVRRICFSRRREEPTVADNRTDEGSGEGGPRLFRQRGLRSMTAAAAAATDGLIRSSTARLRPKVDSGGFVKPRSVPGFKKTEAAVSAEGRWGRPCSRRVT